MAVGDAYVFPGFLTPGLTQLFSHASAKVRGENTSERKFTSTGSRTNNQQVMSPTKPPERGTLRFRMIDSLIDKLID